MYMDTAAYLVLALVTLIGHMSIALGAYLCVRGAAGWVISLLADDHCYDIALQENNIDIMDILGVLTWMLLGFGWVRSAQVSPHCFNGYLEHVRQAVACMIEPLMHMLMSMGVYAILLALLSAPRAEQELAGGIAFSQRTLREQTDLLVAYGQRPDMSRVTRAGKRVLDVDSMLVKLMLIALSIWCYTHIFLAVFTAVARLVKLIIMAIWGGTEFLPMPFAWWVYIMLFVFVGRILGPTLMSGALHVLGVVSMWMTGYRGWL